MNLEVINQEIKTILKGSTNGYDFLFDFSCAKDTKPIYIGFTISKEEYNIISGGYYDESKQYSYNLYNYRKDDIQLFNILHDKIIEIIQGTEKPEVELKE